MGIYRVHTEAVCTPCWCAVFIMHLPSDRITAVVLLALLSLPFRVRPYSQRSLVHWVWFRVFSVDFVWFGWTWKLIESERTPKKCCCCQLQIRNSFYAPLFSFAVSVILFAWFTIILLQVWCEQCTIGGMIDVRKWTHCGGSSIRVKWHIKLNHNTSSLRRLYSSFSSLPFS